MKKIKPLTQIVTQLLEYFAEEGLFTSAAIAKRVEINQSQVYRNLFGTPKRLTQTHLKLCNYAKINVEIKAEDPRSNAILMDALASIWDGSDEHARRLAEMLFAHSRACMINESIKSVRGGFK